MRALSESDGSFSVSHDPSDDPNWLEILVDGLTFDVTGLGPEAQSAVAAISNPEHQFDIQLPDNAELIELQIRPGPHISAAASVPGVFRVHMMLLNSLAQLGGVAGVGWLPSNSLMSPAYFHKIITHWLDGGPFPALGISALRKKPDGAFVSKGLAYFTGQEIEVTPGKNAPQELAKLAIRVIDYLVDYGHLDKELTIESPAGGYLLLSPDADGNVVKVLT